MFLPLYIEIQEYIALINLINCSVMKGSLYNPVPYQGGRPATSKTKLILGALATGSLLVIWSERSKWNNALRMIRERKDALTQYLTKTATLSDFKGVKECITDSITKLDNFVDEYNAFYKFNMFYNWRGELKRLFLQLRENLFNVGEKILPQSPFKTYFTEMFTKFLSISITLS